jgi:DNA modification methylase
MTIEDFSTENPFYCRDAGDVFLGKESVDLFIGHPPYYMAELELNGGDSAKQMQNAKSVEHYYERLLESFLHMEHALKPNGHMFIALDNSSVGLGALKVVSNNTDLTLQTIRLWSYPASGPGQDGTVVFAHYAKKQWDPEESVRGPFVLTNSWEEAYAELEQYNQEYATVGAAPTGLYREMIKNFSKEGDVVCDLFAGCGTVQVVALEMGRKFVYNDVSEDKVVMAKRRIKDILS